MTVSRCEALLSGATHGIARRCVSVAHRNGFLTVSALAGDKDAYAYSNVLANAAMPRDIFSIGIIFVCCAVQAMPCFLKKGYLNL